MDNATLIRLCRDLCNQTYVLYDLFCCNLVIYFASDIFYKHIASQFSGLTAGVSKNIRYANFVRKYDWIGNNVFNKRLQIQSFLLKSMPSTTSDCNMVKNEILIVACFQIVVVLGRILQRFLGQSQKDRSCHHIRLLYIL